MKPTIGRIVHYIVNEPDLVHFPGAPNGNIRAGTILPAIITATFSDTCANLKVFGDHSADAWITSRNCPDEGVEPIPGQWFWPPRV